MSRRATTRAHLCGALIAIALLGSAEASADDQPVVLGAVYNLGGPQSAFDRPSWRGAQLAAEHTNAAGGVLGRQLKLVVADPEGQLGLAADRARAMIESEPAMSAMLGLSDTDMLLATAPAFVDHKLGFVTSGATSPELPAQIPDYLYLACFGDNVQAAAAAEFAYRELAARTASIVYNSAVTYTTLLQGYFRARFEELGGEVVSVAAYAAVDRQADAVSGLADADIVFLAAQEPAEAAAGAEALRQSGSQAPILGGDGFDSQVEWSKHPELDRIYFTTHVYLGLDNPDPAVGAFVESFRRSNGGEMPDAFAALGYDSVGILAASIEAEESAEPAAVLAALGRLRGYRGVTGEISYEDGDRIPRKSVTVLEVNGGEPQFVEQLMPESVPAP